MGRLKRKVEAVSGNHIICDWCNEPIMPGQVIYITPLGNVGCCKACGKILRQWETEEAIVEEE